VFAVWCVDSQEGQQVTDLTSQIHDPSPSSVIDRCSVGGIQSAAIKRRSRCGSVRDCPEQSSHFWPGPTPHVGQRTACTCLRGGFLAFMVLDHAAICGRKTVQFCTESSDRLRKIAITLKTPQVLRRYESGSCSEGQRRESEGHCTRSRRVCWPVREEGKRRSAPRTKVLRAVDAYPVARCESCSALKGIQAWILVPSLRLD
jgi:hypothetical protein